MPRDILDWTLDLLKRLPEALLVHFIVRWVERMLM
jgi:hypothetical protein